MKTILIAIFGLRIAVSAETPDKIAREAIKHWVVFDNGLDPSPEGQRRTAITNSDFSLALYMASDKVPESVRIAYALQKLRGQLGSEVFMFIDGAFQVDPIKTGEMKKRLSRHIDLLEERLVILYQADNQPNKTSHSNPH